MTKILIIKKNRKKVSGLLVIKFWHEIWNNIFKQKQKNKELWER